MMAILLHQMEYGFDGSSFKPFYCSACPYRSVRRCDLKKHLLTHTKDKAYPCPHCNYKGLLKQHLMNHFENQHSSHRPYLCPYCTYRHEELSILVNHVKEHALCEGLFACSYCPFITTHRSSLTRHVNKHTPFSSINEGGD